jgi:ABC-type polysaccharide/polyol phosphate export permease
MFEATLPGSTFQGARLDIRRGLSMWKGWISLARQDVASSYRRTALGPFWISLQQVAFVAGIGVLYSQLLKVDGRDHIPLVAYGISIWGLFTRMVQSSSGVFIDGGGSIRSSNLPRSFFVFHFVARDFMIFLNSVLVLALIPLLYRRTPHPSALIAVPIGIVCILSLGVGFGLWLGPLSVRYRDVNVGVGSLLQIALFLTPIFWNPKTLGESHWAVKFNPLGWIVNLIREPLLGQMIDVRTLVLVFLFTVVNLTVGFVTFAKRRLGISYLA